MQRRHHQVGSINQRLIKLKPGQKTAFPFPLMVSPWLCKRQANISSLNPYSLPFFIPLHFACRRRPNPIHLFVPFSIAMFSGWGFNPFSILLFAVLWLTWELFYKNVLCHYVIGFTGDIEYLLFVLFGSEVFYPHPFFIAIFTDFISISPCICCYLANLTANL